MRIKFWGARGSIPTPESYAEKYGGNTTCVEVRLSDNSLILIDAGSGLRNAGIALTKESKFPDDIHLYLTHAHWDHLMGFPFFRPAFMKGKRIHVRGGVKAKRSLEKFLSHQMERPYFPIDFESLNAEFDFTSGAPVKRHIGCGEIIPIALSHPDGGYGCKIIDEGKTFVFLTDNELGYRHEGGLQEKDYIAICTHADLLVHDAQYTDEEYESKRTWGHSTYNQAMLLASSARVKKLGFFHHDPERTDEEIERQVALSREKLKQANRSIECFAVSEGMEFSL